jgi:hypothetical protein
VAFRVRLVGGPHPFSFNDSPLTKYFFDSEGSESLLARGLTQVTQIYSRLKTTTFWILLSCCRNYRLRIRRKESANFYYLYGFAGKRTYEEYVNDFSEIAYRM